MVAPRIRERASIVLIVVALLLPQYARAQVEDSSAPHSEDAHGSALNSRPLTSQDIANLVHSTERDFGAFRTSIVIHDWFARHADSVPEWNSIVPSLTTNMEIIRRGPCIKVASTGMKADGTKAEQMITAWDGEVFTALQPAASVLNVVGNDQTVMLSSPQSIFTIGCAFAGRGIDGNLLPLSAIVLESAITWQKWDGDVFTCRVRKENAKGVTFYEFQIDAGRGPRLCRFAWELPPRHPDTNTAGFRNRYDAEVTQWMDAPFGQIPARMVRETRLFSDVDAESGPLLVGRTEFVRDTFEPIAASEPAIPGEFRLSVGDGGTVYDARYNIGYVVGGNTISVDGVGYVLDQPVPADPGPVLRNLLANAKIPQPGVLSPAAGSGASSARTSGQSGNPLQWGLTVASVLAAAAGLFLLHRGRGKLPRGRAAS